MLRWGKRRGGDLGNQGLECELLPDCCARVVGAWWGVEGGGEIRGPRGWLRVGGCGFWGGNVGGEVGLVCWVGRRGG